MQKEKYDVVRTSCARGLHKDSSGWLVVVHLESENAAYLAQRSSIRDMVNSLRCSSLRNDEPSKMSYS